MQRRLRRQAEERVALAAAEAARARRRGERRGARTSSPTRAACSSGSLDVEMRRARLLELLVPAVRAPRRRLALLDDAAGGVALVVADAAVRPRRRRRALRAAAARRASCRAAELDALRSASPAAARSALARVRRRTPSRCRWSTGGRALGALLIAPSAERRRAPTAPALDELADARGDRVRERAPVPQPAGRDRRSGAASRRSCRSSNRRKDEFLAMLSHELRNPLAPIRTALEVIRRLAPAEPKLTWATDVMDRQVQHLTRLVDDLLDVARISQGKIALQTRAARPARRASRTASRPRSRSLDGAPPPPDAAVPPTRRSGCAATSRGCRRSSRTCSTTPPSTPRRAARSSCRWRCRRTARR